ncbi:MAG: deoxyribose-phosphate aldolase [Enhydrobacter sp.]|nr:deoxyribose-phosphate aldolase [Enhydrobacter sp.]
MQNTLALTRPQLAAKLQSTLMRPDVTRQQVAAHIEACAEHSFNAAMIPMADVPLARAILEGTKVKVATAICFGTGYESVAGKVALVDECRALGADEVDYGPNMSLFLSGEFDAFRDESAALVEAAGDMTLKAMLELHFIETTDEQKHAAQLLEEAGVPWIKNSSGGGPRPGQATPAAIQLLRAALKPETHIKASGGIKSHAGALELIRAGAELLGTSAALAILEGVEVGDTGY